MEKLLKSLHPRISVKKAGTGTIYVNFNGKKIRVADHEPNEAAKRIRGKADFEIYTHDLVGKEINSKYDVVEKVAKFLKLEIKGTTKAAITRYNNRELKKAKEIAKIKAKNDAEFSDLKTLQRKFYAQIRKVVKGKEVELKKLLEESQAYGDLGSNGAKRRKRKTSYFKQNFKLRFGLEATPNDVDTALNA